MKKQGFASMYMVYSFFLVFIMLMLSTLMINNYKKNFLNTLKNDIKEELKDYKIEVNTPNIEGKNIENLEEPS